MQTELFFVLFYVGAVASADGSALVQIGSTVIAYLCICALDM